MLQPLVNHEKLWLEAAYPLSLRSVVEPVLNRERSNFKRALDMDKKQSVLVQLSHSGHDSHDSRASTIGTLFGVALGEAIKRIFFEPH